MRLPGKAPVLSLKSDDGCAHKSKRTAYQHPNLALSNPCGLALAADKTLYIADTGNHRIVRRAVDGTLTTLAGDGTRGDANGPPDKARFAHPCGLAIDAEGNLYVADCGNNRIRRVSPDGYVTTIAGSGVAGHCDGHGSTATFHNPCGIAISDDTLYVADYSNNSLRVVSKSGVVATLAHHDSDELDAPYGVAIFREPCAGAGGATDTDNAPSTWILVTSFHGNSLSVISPDGRIQKLAGGGAADLLDACGEEAAFNAPNGLAVDAAGNIFVADSGNHCVRAVSPEGEVTTLAGTGEAALSDSHFNSPCGICVCNMPDVGPCLLVTDRANSCVRVVPVDCDPPPHVEPSTLKRDLRRLLDSDSAAEPALRGEAVFEVEGRTLRVSKAVLCVRCAHFRDMFTTGMRESYEAVVRISDVSYDTFCALVDYLLTDELAPHLAAEKALDLLLLANAYMIVRLEQLCASRLVEIFDEGNVAEVARCATLIGATQLERAATRWMRSKEFGRCTSAVESPMLGGPYGSPAASFKSVVK